MGMAPCFLEMPSSDLRMRREMSGTRTEGRKNVRPVHVLHADTYVWLLHKCAVKADDERRRASMHDL